jgi:hypothetical protein
MAKAKATTEQKPELYRLKVGQHEQREPDWEPSREDLAIAERTLVAPRAPTAKYKAGDLVPSPIDLVARFGANKFEYVNQGSRALGDNPVPAEPAADQDPTHFPGGQVSSGHQQATGTPQGTVSGPDRRRTHDARLEPSRTPQARVDEPGRGAATGTDVEEAARKSARAQEEGSEAPTEEGLAEMKVEELREYARTHGISLHGATRKEEMIRAIQDHDPDEEDDE